MDNTTFGAAVAVAKKALTDPTVIEGAVSDWLDDHPEATTTVQDGSITKAKLDASLQGTVDDVGDLKTQIEEMPEIKDSTESGIDLDISDPDGNVILRLKDGHIQTLNFNSNPNANSITVAASGADYTSIREAIEAAETAGASNDNPYTIKIAPGNYDVLSYFTAEEIAESDFKGLFVTDGIMLEGMGIAPDNVVLYAEMNTETYNETKRNSVSTLNFHGNVALKNLTVRSKNIRYSVHDDTGFQSAGKKIRVIENCRFFADFTTSGGYGNISYGAGTDGNKVFVFRDCDFGDLVHIHTNAGSKSNIVIMENCRGFGFTANDYASSVDNYYYVNNSVFNWINTGKATGWTTQHIVWRGNIKGAMVGGWEGMRYEFGDCMRYQHSPVTNYPRAVAMETTGRYRLKTTSSADSVIGVLLFYDSTNDYAVVQHGGWLCAEIIGLANPTVGQYLVVGSGGALTLESSDTNAIGKVVCTNNAGQHFIKLFI